MIQDFRETLEVTPLQPADGVSLDMRTEAIRQPICHCGKAKAFTPLHFRHLFMPIFHSFVCFPQIDQGRICVCVRKRPLSKQGKVEVFYSISPEMTSKIKQRLTN